MKIPPNMTEKEVLQIIDETGKALASSYTFGIYDENDIYQEIFLLCCDALERFDNKRPLANFLHVHCKNRLSNLRRNLFHRNDPPCLLCHQTIGNRTPHEDGQFCDKYKAWKKRNDSKRNLMAPLDLSNISDENEKGTKIYDESLEVAEILKIIDIYLDVGLRATYLRMRAGENVPKSKRTEIERAIKDILKEKDICLSELEN